MVTVLSESTPVARKNHKCNACEFILDTGVSGFGFSFSELRIIARAKSNDYEVVKGSKYIRQNNVSEGYLYTFKAIPEIHEICLKYNLYDQ